MPVSYDIMESTFPSIETFYIMYFIFFQIGNNNPDNLKQSGNIYGKYCDVDSIYSNPSKAKHLV